MRWVAVLLGALIAFSLASGGRAPASQAHAGGLIAQIRIGCALPQPLADCTAYVDAVRLFDAAAGTFSDVASCSCSLESAQWSPDGRRLLIHAGAAFELYEAGAVRALPGLVNIAWAAWEPSGRSLLVSLRGGRLERIDLAGHVLASLGTVRGVEKLDVSPRGLIAYDRAPRPRRNRVVPSSIWVAQRDGTHSRRLTEGQAPRWSPNGRWITYSRFGLRGAEVWVMRASGGRPRPLSRAATEIGPAWSPDGRRVAFVRCAHEKCQIRTVGSHGGPSTRVASAVSPGFALDWQRNAVHTLMIGAPAGSEAVQPGLGDEERVCGEAKARGRPPATPARDDMRSSAPAPNSRLLSAEERACPHTTYVRELASPTTSRSLATR